MAKLRGDHTIAHHPSTLSSTDRRSQRPTSQPPTHPARRSTRQRSNQPSSAPNSPNKNPRRAASAELHISLDESDHRVQHLPASTASRSGKLKKVRKPLEQPHEALNTVAEEEDSEVDILDAQEGDAAPASPAQNLPSPSAQSDRSGTTAITSFSVNAVNELSDNKETLLQLLPDLHDFSVLMLRRLALEELTINEFGRVLEELEQPTSSIRERLDSIRTTFEGLFDKFVTPPGHFIRTEHVISALLGRTPLADLPDGPWRPDDILYKANLADAVYRLAVGEYKDASYLQMLDGSFPLQFAGNLGSPLAQSGHSSLVDKTFECSLALRTHLAVTRLVAEADSQGEYFEPNRIVLSVFWEHEVDWSQRDTALLKGWGVKAFEKADGSLLKKYALRVLKRTEALCNFITPDSSGWAIDFEGLLATFHGVTLLAGMIGWAAARNTEVTAAISRKGGADQITTTLKQQSRQGMTSTKLTPAAMGAVGATILTDIVQGLGLAEGDRFSGRRSLTLADARPENDSAALPDEGAAPAFNDDDPEPLEMDREIRNVEAQAMSRALATTIATNSHSKSSQRGSKSLGAVPSRSPKKRFTDPQANAERLDFLSQEGPSPARSRLQAVPETAAGPSGADVSDDEGFGREDDAGIAKQKEIAAHKRTRAKALQDRGVNFANSRHAKRPAAEDRLYSLSPADEDDEEEEETATSRTPTERPQKRRRTGTAHLPATSGDREKTPVALPSSPPASNYPAVNRGAKLRTTQQNASKGPQKRKPWTEEETRWFIYYIEEYGCSWSRIKAVDAGRHLAERDQVGLKDKARNMTFDYLVQGVQMPRNLDKVALPKSMKDRLEARGIYVDED